MPTILTHAAVPLALGICLGRQMISPRLMAAGMLAAIVPDADVIGFKFGIAYLDNFGHRGASHSIAFALLLGCLASLMAKPLQSSRLTAFCLIAIATVSHGLLDMCTNGGEGVALFWPLSGQRWFFPWQVIEVSPIALKKVFSARGLAVLLSEIIWVWLPLTLACALGLFWRQHATEVK